MILVSIVAGVVLGFMPFGQRVYATGGNIRAAGYAGINTSRIRFIALLCLCAIPTTASAERPDVGDRNPGDRGNRAPTCNQGAINECYARVHAHANNTRATAQALEPRMRALEAELPALRKTLSEQQQKIDLLNPEIAMLSAEIESAGVATDPRAAAVLPGFPALEDYFGLHALEKSWMERNAAGRRQILSARQVEAKGELQDLTARNEKIAGEFQRLNSEYQSTIAQRSTLLAAADQQENRDKGTCNAQNCH
jgi:peptidoglycan hydrolase CwlO-like protein